MIYRDGRRRPRLVENELNANDGGRHVDPSKRESVSGVRRIMGNSLNHILQ